MIKILHITPNFNYNCGRSKLIYYYLNYFGNHSNYETHFITNGGDSLDRLKEIPSLKFKILKFSEGYKNILYLNNFYKKLKTYVNENKINIIHTHHRFPELIAVRIGKRLNFKTVVSTHGFIYGFTKISFQSDIILSVSNSMSDYLTNKFKLPKEKIITRYNPTYQSQNLNSSEVEKFKKENDIAADQKVLLFVGRISKEKGYDTLLKSFELVGKQNKNLVLIVNGEINKKVNDFASILKNNKIIYVAPRNNISNLYSIADLVILPSRKDSFPFVMIEAGSFKKPFIGGNTGGIAEFIEEGKNGLLVDPENPGQLAEKIIYLLNNPDIAKRLGENLFEKVNRLCDYNNYFFEVEKIYNSLLASE